MINKVEFFRQISLLEEQAEKFHDRVTLVKQQAVALLEENQQLKVENEKLRERLFVLEHNITISNTEHRHEDEDIVTLYNEGFHVCNVDYGRLRANGDCLFCRATLGNK